MRNHRLVVFAGRPGNGDAGIDVPVIGLAEACSHAAETLWAAGREIEWIRASLDFVKDIEEAVTRSEV